MFRKSSKKSGNSYNFNEVRKELNLIGGISYKDVSKVANFFDCDYVLLNEQHYWLS